MLGVGFGVLLALLAPCQAFQEECDPGMYRSHVSFGDEGSCQPCPPGTFSEISSNTCNVCPAGSIANPGSDRCTLCAQGQYASGNTCVPCPVGTFNSGPGMTSCQACSPGTVTTEESSGNCLPCAPGWFALDTSTCAICPEGTYSIGSSCLLCPPGRYSGKGQHKCHECPRGQFSSNRGASECSTCPVGFFSKMASSSCYAVECPVNSVYLEGGCQCEEGYAGSIIWDDAVGQFVGSCAPCETGYWSTLGGECSLNECPTHSSNHPFCTCNLGFNGTIRWAAGRFEGACTEFGCDQNSHRNLNDNTTCQCSENYALSFDGSCKRCAGGESVVDGVCEPQECPANSIGFPACKCRAGFSGHIYWDYVKSSWQGKCERCPRGTWSTGGYLCHDVACPANSEGHPDCKCQPGYSGLITWVGGNYAGECKLCPKGYKRDSTTLDRKCEKTECPANSGGHPHCTCFAGFFGVLEWNPDIDRYTGDCKTCPSGFWSEAGSDHCFPVSCPPNSDGHPDCVCLQGSYGHIRWDMNYMGNCELCQPGTFQDQPNRYSCKPCGKGLMSAVGATSCIQVECPAHGENWPNCQCPPGYSGNITWIPERLSYSGSCSRCPVGEFSSSNGDPCQQSQCPENADNFPFCTCKKGYNGQVVWDSIQQSFVGTCVESSCPPNSNGYPDCACDIGYSGVLTWDADSSSYSGECVPCGFGKYQDIPGAASCKSCDYLGHQPNRYQSATSCDRVDCPAHSHGWPACHCNAGTWTSQTGWNQRTFSYETLCEACPLGYWSAPNAGACERTLCPEYSENHPHCFCSDGHYGNLTWVEGSFIGTCSRLGCPPHQNGVDCHCAKGYMLIDGKCERCPKFTTFNSTSQSCERVLCPEGSSMVNGECVCPHNEFGKIIWISKEGTGSFLGSCTECPAGFASQNQSSECVRIECPAETGYRNPEGNCVCADGFEGEIIEFERRLIVRCSPCGAGYYSHQGIPCQKVACPAGSSGHPNCTCNEGFMGALSWDDTLEIFVGSCSPCHQGYSSSQAGVCEVVNCPPNTSGHPSCRCNPQFEGSVEWNGTHWDSDCSKCSQGYSASLDSSCVPIMCPYGSIGWPDCVCAERHIGSVVWHQQLGEYIGACQECPDGTIANVTHCSPCEKGMWTGDGLSDCQQMICPANAHDDGDGCVCNAGFSGVLYWGLGEWTGECLPCSTGYWSNTGDTMCWKVACPDRSSKHPVCECDAPYAAQNIPIVWSAATGEYLGTCSLCPAGHTLKVDSSGLSRCAPVQCPRNSAGHPNCTCDWGYEGSIEWHALSGKYLGMCEKCPKGYVSQHGSCVSAPCPHNSQNHPSCQCISGYTGLLHFKPNRTAIDARGSAVSRHYVGKCSPCPMGKASHGGANCTNVPCPPNSRGYPNCACNEGYWGSILWDYGRHTYSGICSSNHCPQGSAKDRLTGKCECIAGFSSAFDNTSLPVHNLTCTTCPPGTWSEGGNSPCNIIACPIHSSGAPRCKCDSGFMGTVQWHDGAFHGNCEECPAGYWPSSDQRSCIKRNCPENAFMHPSCKCKAGYEGQIVWANGDYSGQCSRCPKGFWASFIDHSCERVECPANGGHHPHCSCVTDYEGVVSWDSTSGEYMGTCSRCPAGFLSDDVSTGCSLLECPSKSSGHPNCECYEGYQGRIQWNSEARTFKGSCMACPPGFWRTGNETECTERLCPPGSSGSNGICTCDPGYEGLFLWRSGHYMGGCKALTDGLTSHNGIAVSVPCPPNAMAHPSCQCEAGFVGKVAWNFVEQSFEGSCDRCPAGYREEAGQCVAVPCSDPASGSNPCACLDGYFGSIEWDSLNSEWFGVCRTCPVGYTSSASTRRSHGDSSTTTCEIATCPDNSEKHPYCVCSSGYWGTIVWNGFEYNGECLDASSLSPYPTPSSSPTPSLTASSSFSPSTSLTPSPSPSTSLTPCLGDIRILGASADGLYTECESDLEEAKRYCFQDWALEWRPGNDYVVEGWRLSKGLFVHYRTPGPRAAYLPGNKWEGMTMDDTDNPNVACVSRTMEKGCCVTHSLDEQLKPCCHSFEDFMFSEECPVAQTISTLGHSKQFFQGEYCSAVRSQFIDSSGTPVAQARSAVILAQGATHKSSNIPQYEYHVHFTLVLKEGTAATDFHSDEELVVLVRAAVADATGAEDVSIKSVTTDRIDKEAVAIELDLASKDIVATTQAFRAVRNPQMLANAFVHVCSQFFCDRELEVLATFNDYATEERLHTVIPSGPTCGKFVGVSVEWCNSHEGCWCSKVKRYGGVSGCDECIARALLPRPPTPSSGEEDRGDDYEMAELTSRRERAMLGMWKQGIVPRRDGGILRHLPDTVPPMVPVSSPETITAPSRPNVMAPPSRHIVSGRETEFDRNGSQTEMPH